MSLVVVVSIDLEVAPTTTQIYINVFVVIQYQIYSISFSLSEIVQIRYYSEKKKIIKLQ